MTARNWWPRTARPTTRPTPPKRCCGSWGIPDTYDARVAYEPHSGPHECGNEECYGYAPGYRIKKVPVARPAEGAA